MKRLYKLKHQARQTIQSIKALSPIRMAIFVGAFLIVAGGSAAFALQQTRGDKPVEQQLAVAAKNIVNGTSKTDDTTPTTPSSGPAAQGTATAPAKSGSSAPQIATSKLTTLVLSTTSTTTVRGQSVTLTVSTADGQPIAMPRLQGGSRNILLNAPGGPPKSVWTIQLRAWESAPLGRYALTISAQDKHRRFVSAGLTLTVAAPPTARFTLGHLIPHTSEPGTQAQHFSLQVGGSSNFSGPIRVYPFSSNPGVTCSMVTYDTSVGEQVIRCFSSSPHGAQGTLSVTVTGGGESRSTSSPFSIAANNGGI